MFSNNNSDILDKLVAELDRRYKSCNALAPLAFLNKIHILLAQDSCSAAAVLQIKKPFRFTRGLSSEIEPFGEFIRTKENRWAIASPNKENNLVISFSKQGLLKCACDQCLWRVFSFSKPGLVKNRLWSTMGHVEPELEVSHFPLTSSKVIFLCSVPFYHLVHGVQYSLK